MAPEPDSQKKSEPGRIIKVQAVGRPFQLGMLYDCRSDLLIPGITLWNRETIEEDVTVKKTNSTKLEIKTSDSLSDKADVLDIDASLKLSFMGGLISVEGSAKYFDDKVSSSHQERVTLSYHCVTKFESLNMGTLATEKIQHSTILEDDMATHVVTGIQCGANVLFIFDKHHEKSESKRVVKGAVKALVKSVPSFQIEGDASVKLSEDQKEVSKGLNCTFHGDVRPDTNPTTFEEAIKVYKGLNKLVGEDGQPLTVWLYPLDKLDNKAAKIVRDISIDVILRVEEIFEGFQNIFMKCHDLESNAICSELLSFRKQVEDFEKLVKDHKLRFQKKILPILPKIRGGSAPEKDLADVIDELSQSPFSADRLNNWIAEREKQLNVINHIYKFIEGIQCISSNELEAELMDPDDEHTLCFMLKIPATNEQMTAMQNYSIKKEPVWLNKETVDGGEICENRKTIESARRFRYFHNANSKKTKEMEKGTKTAFFLSEVSSPSDHVSGSIYHYTLGEVVSKEFSPPSRPENLEIVKISEDSVSLKWDQSKPGTEAIEEYEIEYHTFVEGDSSNDNKNTSTENSSKDNKNTSTGNSSKDNKNNSTENSSKDNKNNSTGNSSNDNKNTSTENSSKDNKNNSTGKSSNDYKIISTGDSSNEYVLSSLIPSTAYWFKCRAVVPSGVSAYCDELGPVSTSPESGDLQDILKKMIEPSILMVAKAKKVLRNLLNVNRKVYARQTNGNVVYYSEIEDKTTNFRLTEFSTAISPSESSIILEFDIVKTLVTGCFLEMSHQKRSIGELEILFSPEKPKRVDHMIMLCSGSNGSARLRGSGFDYVGAQGHPGECVHCFTYSSGKSSSALHQVEEDGSVPCTEGVVYGVGGQKAGFGIYTRTEANTTWSQPLIGHLTATGLRELQTAANKGKEFIEKVIFSKCGLLIDATSTTA